MARKKAARKAASAPKKASPLKGRMRTPPWPPYPAWSSSRFFGFLRSSLRAAYSKYPCKYEVLAEASRPYVGPDRRRKKEYQCAECKGWFGSSEVNVDHRIPAGSLTSFEDLPGFCERLFCGKDGLQVLCTKGCHARKTLEERAANKEIDD